ncbi:Ribosome production factor 1 [Linum perenne]
MGAKRKQSETLDDHDEADGDRRGSSSKDKRSKPTMEKKEELRPAMIKNKEKRSALHNKLKQQKKLDKRKAKKAREAADKQAIELGDEPPARKVPRTIENTREADETVCKPDDAELFVANDADEFSSILRREKTPKILITTCRFHSTRGPALIKELLSVIPNAHYFKRGTYDLKKIIEYATKEDFTSIIVVHTSRREPGLSCVCFSIDMLLACFVTKQYKIHSEPTPNNSSYWLATVHDKYSSYGLSCSRVYKYSVSDSLIADTDALLITALPSGPTAHFKLSNLILRKDIKNHGNPTGHIPELILNHFTTRLGHRVGRMIQSLFPQNPNFRGRRVATFHNQRDFIFFRHHRYIFEEKDDKQKDSKSKKVIARLQECGPRFTLKLKSLQHGTFDTKGGEYEWVHKPEMDTSRRRFFL